MFRELEKNIKLKIKIMEQRELQVGDVLYANDRWAGLIKVTIDRVTKTRAIHRGTTIIKRTCTYHKHYQEIGGGRMSFHLEDDHLKKQYEIQTKLGWFSEHTFTKKEKLMIYDLLNK